MSLRVSGAYLGAMTALVLGFAMLSGRARADDGAYDSGGTGAAENYLRDAKKAAYHGHYSEALADDNKALALSPHYGRALQNRVQVYIEMGLYAQAAADLETVIAMHPDDMDLNMTKARLALIRGDGKGTLVELKHALSLPLFTHWHAPHEAGTGADSGGEHYHVTGHMESIADEYSSIANQLLHNDDASLMQMQSMLKIEYEHPEHILARYCCDAALAGLLESAELTCQEAIDQNAHDIGQYDSLGFTHLRMKQWDKAIADYNKALDSRDDLTLSLYGRGLAKRAKGDRAGAAADMAAAIRDEPDIANIMKRLGAPDV
jgi:tetratricopeptide (TPR) repeat protein